MVTTTSVQDMLVNIKKGLLSSGHDGIKGKHTARTNGHAGFNAETLLDKLSLEDKIRMLSGSDMWHTHKVEYLNIPRVRMSDGPNGVRGTSWLNGAGASCTPCATGLGASFDIDLLRRVGKALGQECRARGVHCLLGPTTNIQRHPLGGRGFESYAEDPYLSGRLAQAWIQGVQSEDVMVSSKHFVANEQEHYRRSNDSVIDERTLHEIYLEPFRIQCMEKPSTFMSSYNRLNGLHTAEHPRLLRDILRKEFEFDGMIMSDWSGTCSSSDAIKAGLDLEMPGPSLVRGPAVERDVLTGKLTVEDIDVCVLRVLRFVQEAIESGIPFEAEETTVEDATVRALLREAAAAAVVLLKNDADLLPLRLQPGQKIAIIGPNAKDAYISGGGSASLVPSYSVSPLQAIKSVASASQASVSYCEGADVCRWLPLLTPHLTQESGATGVDIRFYGVDPWNNVNAPVLHCMSAPTSFTYFMDSIPAEVPVRGYVSMTTTFTPDISGIWELGLGVAGQADLYVDGKKLIDNSTKQRPGLLFFSSGTEEEIGHIDAEAGKQYRLEIRFSNFKQLSQSSPYAGRRGGIRLAGRKQRDWALEHAKAITLAKHSDVSILVVGNTAEWESEGYDRSTMDLPMKLNRLTQDVLKANPCTIVVVQSGMPVSMPWVYQTNTVVQAFFGGNETGNGIADVLFGKVSPSGKLPLTFAKRLEDYPTYDNFGERYTTVYAEGVNVGYRYFDQQDRPRAAFPFGFGLSYGTFSWTNLRLVRKSEPGNVQIHVTVANTSMVAAADTVQIYVHEMSSRVSRPEMELKGFTKVFLQPEESREITISLDHTAFSYYDVNLKTWRANAGAFEIRVAKSSTQVHTSLPFQLSKSYTWTGLRQPTEFVQ